MLETENIILILMHEGIQSRISHILRIELRNGVQLKVETSPCGLQRIEVKYLPRVMISHRRIEDKIIVKTKVNGVDMAKKTGPFFSITHACK